MKSVVGLEVLAAELDDWVWKEVWKVNKIYYDHDGWDKYLKWS